MDSKTVLCPRCKGAGEVTWTLLFSGDYNRDTQDQRLEKCPKCNGRGDLVPAEPSND